MLDFNHQAVRDLAWCCTSAPLLNEFPGSDAVIWPEDSTKRNVREEAEWLASVDRAPDGLFAELEQQKSTRLGLYYEILWRFYWQQHPHWQLLAQNLQVLDAGQTFGAFDFLLKHKNTFWHIEMAVKFYLGIPGENACASSWDQWIGPNCSDRLDIKLTRMQQHQLPLSTSKAGLNATKIFTHVWQRALCLQGYFFYPAHDPDMAAPIAAHPEHGKGLWWHMSSFIDSLKTNNNSLYWMILPRDRWLSPAYSQDINELLYGENLRLALRHWVGTTDRPQLIAAMRKHGDTWIEEQRCFIVPDHWPWTAKPSRNT